MKNIFYHSALRQGTGILLAAVLMTLLLCSCSDAKTRRYDIEGETYSSATDSVLCASTGGLSRKKKLASSGMTTIYFDEKDFAPIIENQGAVWRSLPSEIAKSSKETPSVLSLEVVGNNRCFSLNSQSDAVKKAKPVTEKTDSGIRVTYNFSFPDGEKTVNITVPVDFSLEDGSFIVDVDCSQIVVSDKDYTVTRLRLMDYFGSTVSASEGDYILVPDNCGAIIDTYKAKSNFKALSFKVYGDMSKNNALTGVYGMKRGSSAFVAMIEKGDGIAYVNASVAASTGYNRTGAEFEITENTVSTVKDKERLFVSGNSYDGEIRLCYRFISGSNANYSGMATACREHLIRLGVLPADTVEISGNSPFILTATGEASDTAGKAQVLTNYEQLLDMLTYLKGKGFSNIYVRYKGALTGNLNQSVITKCEKLKTLGTQVDYSDLTGYASAQQVKLFYDLGFTSCSSSSARPALLARDASDSLYTDEKINLLGASSKRALAAYDRIDDNIIGVFSLSQKEGIPNISVSDAGAFLYSDCGSGSTREDVKNIIVEKSASLRTIGDVMLEKGNFYMLKNISCIVSMPLSASVKENGSYRSVPFVPLVLHSTVEYGGEPVNLSSDYTKAVLRCVEYGALLNFEWCYENTGESTGAQENTEKDGEKMKPYSYSDWATSAYAFYDKANRALNDLRDTRMTAHYKLKNGVYCTEYGETSVYVNYNDKEVTIGGVTVAAKDFVRVN